MKINKKIVAAAVVLASEAAVKSQGLKPMARLVGYAHAGVEPTIMGIGPVPATRKVLQRTGLKVSDLDVIESNEAFAAQVLGCLAAWKDADYCRTELGLGGAMGELNTEKLNVDGGAIALGHPVGASGTRIVLHLLHALKRTGGKRGIAAICIGGGLGGAMLVEAL